MRRSGQTADRLISGRLRGKAARAGAVHAKVSVDGTEYAWSYRHGWLVWGKALKVISLSVSLAPGRSRELILDFAVRAGAAGTPPAEPRVMQALEDGIRAARAAGWEPESRGRAFRYAFEDPS